MATTVVTKAYTPVAVVASGGTVAAESNALSGVIDPASTGWAYAPRARWVFSGTFAAAPGGNPGVLIFYRLSLDGGTTNFETDRGRSLFPVRPMAAAIPLDVGNATQARVSDPVDVPEVPFEVILVNEGTGQDLQAGWSLGAIPVTEQVV